MPHGLTEKFFVGLDQGVGGDHGAHSGLGDDDHSQYLLASGTRAMAGDLDMAGFNILNLDQLQAVSGTPLLINDEAGNLRIRVWGDIAFYENDGTSIALLWDQSDQRWEMNAPLVIDQLSTTGALPVLTLDQADVDEDFFKIIGTSDTNVDRALVDAVNFTTPGAIVGWMKVNVQDDQATDPIVDGDYYVPFYAAPTA